MTLKAAVSHLATAKSSILNHADTAAPISDRPARSRISAIDLHTCTPTLVAACGEESLPEHVVPSW